MTKEQKIEFLMKRIGDRLTKQYLLSKSDEFIDRVFAIESQQDDLEAEEAAFELCW